MNWQIPYAGEQQEERAMTDLRRLDVVAQEKLCDEKRPSVLAQVPRCGLQDHVQLWGKVMGAVRTQG